MVATCVHFSWNKGGRSLLSMWEGKFPKIGGNHDSKCKVTELSTVVSYSCYMSKKGKLLAAGMAFLPPLVFTILVNGPIVIRPNQPLQEISPHSMQCTLFCFRKSNVCSAYSLFFCLSKILLAPMKACLQKFRKQNVI